MDLKAASMIQLYLANEVMYNVMDEETVTRLWSRSETLYMMKSLSNKLYLNKQLYGLRMKEGTIVLEHFVCPKDIPLVLMMTNSCSYSTNDLIVFKFQILIKILVDI